MTYDYVGGFTRDWLAAGVIDKVWYLAVFVACAVAVTRAVRVARDVFRPRARRLTLSEALGPAGLTADEIATLALAGAVVPAGGQGTRPTSPDPLGAGHRIEAVQARFAYRWHLADARVASTRGLLGAALLVTLLASVGGVPALIEQEFGDGGWAWAAIQVAERVGVRLSIMLSQCLVICIVWSTLDTALRRRRAAWHYAVATTRDASPAAI